MNKKQLISVGVFSMIACALATVDVPGFDIADNDDNAMARVGHRHLLGSDSQLKKGNSQDKVKDKVKEKNKKDKFICPSNCENSECCKCGKKHTLARLGSKCTADDGQDGICIGKYKCKPIVFLPPSPVAPISSPRPHLQWSHRPHLQWSHRPHLQWSHRPHRQWSHRPHRQSSHRPTCVRSLSPYLSVCLITSLFCQSSTPYLFLSFSLI